MSQGLIEIKNPEILASSETLIVPSFLSEPEFDALLPQLQGKNVTWVIEETAVILPSIQKKIAAHSGAGIAFSKTDEALSLVGEKLKQSLGKDGIAIFLPGQALSNKGTHTEIPGDILKALTQLSIDIQPLAIHRASEVSLKVFRDTLKSDTTMTLCPVIPSAKISTGAILQAILLANEEAFSNRSFLNSSLTRALVTGLKRYGSSNSLVDGSDDSRLSYGKILGVSMAFSKEIKKATQKSRVGIILPPGKGGLIANLAVLLAGKTPVNLNFTVSQDAVKSAIRQADLDRFITADAFMQKVQAFPWPAQRQIIFIERVLPKIKKRIIRSIIISKLMPTRALCKWLNTDQRSGDDEAVLLFTSGSSGEPKGVSLSHRNLLANVCQFTTRVSLGEKASTLGSLPLFHSFGCTVTLFFPILEGVDLITYPSPLEVKRLGELIEKHEIKLLLSTPTFLRGFLRRIKPEQLSSLKLVVTGAEKLPASLAHKFYERFGHMPLEGYGLTETSPATNVNISDPIESDELPTIPAKREGSVGQMLPGIAARTTHVDTDKPTCINEKGILWLKGSNVFQGYLNRDDLSKKVIDADGWFCTGDVARFDDDGFLFIEGRMSRFSKIGGEMVPHEAVEEAITKALNLEQEEERKIAIVGVADEQKGEALRLLSSVASETLHQENIDLRYKLLDMGIPALWCPREIKAVEKIPMLASGKLDLKACAELAQ